MSLDRSWQFVGGLESWPYRTFETLRRRLNRRLVGFLFRQLRCADARSPCRVLEPGCGTAYALSLMQQHHDVALAVAADLDESALREGKKSNPELIAVVADLERLPFADNAFRLVYNSSTIEHLETPATAVREMQRVCERQGRVFVGVPYLFGPLAFQPVIRGTKLGRWLGPVFTQRSLRALLSRADLEPETAVTYVWRFFIGMTAQKELTKPFWGPAQRNTPGAAESHTVLATGAHA